MLSSSRRRRPRHTACCSCGLSNSLMATLSRSVHQRRPGFHLIVTALLFRNFPPQGAKAPDMQPAVGSIPHHSDRRQASPALCPSGRLSTPAASALPAASCFYHSTTRKGDFQVIGHLIPLPGFAVDGHAGHLTQPFALQRIEQRQLERRCPAKKRFRIVTGAGRNCALPASAAILSAR